jgi:molybdopterin-binding protein
MKISARNAIKGTVKSIHPGMVNTEVVIEVLPGIEVTSVITKSSAKNLDLKVGDIAYAVIKSSNVMVAKSTALR